jgi:hypothetical protein
MTCKAQRAIQDGSRRGHCSKMPKAIIATSATQTSRPITRHVERLLKAGLMSRPTSVAAARTTTTRRQLNIKAKPCGLGDTVVEDICARW